MMAPKTSALSSLVVLLVGMSFPRLASATEPEAKKPENPFWRIALRSIPLTSIHRPFNTPCSIKTPFPASSRESSD